MSSSPFDRVPHQELWAVDFEFIAHQGEQQDPVCMVAKELRSGRVIRLWRNDLQRMDAPPYPTGESTLFIAYYASPEIGCHLALGWPIPVQIFDCFTEFRNLTNGRRHPLGDSLLAALASYGINSIAADKKSYMRDLIMSGGPWNNREKLDILNYCQSDVEALNLLFPRLIQDVLNG